MWSIFEHQFLCSVWLFLLFMFQLWVIWSADENALIVVIVDFGSPVKLLLKVFAASGVLFCIFFRISFYLAPSSFTLAIAELFFEENYKQTAATNIIGVVCSRCWSFFTLWPHETLHKELNVAFLRAKYLHSYLLCSLCTSWLCSLVFMMLFVHWSPSMNFTHVLLNFEFFC